MDADKWATLPDDLLVDIFRRIDLTAVIRCAGTCRPWRHSIINNGSFLRPRPDRFFPNLLLGFLEGQRLQYIPASNSTVPFLVPATGVRVADGRIYSNLISSRDGFLLLGEDNGSFDSLCLCTAHTGNCRVLPAAEFDNCYLRCMYILVTGYDVVDDCAASDDSNETAVRILAVDWLQNAENGGMNYQIFSSTSGAWGPVKCSAKLPEDVVMPKLYTGPFTAGSGSVVVCHGAISWFGFVVSRNTGARSKCIFSMDLRTERTWTTELPDVDMVATLSLVLAVSEDGRLSLVRMQRCLPHMQVWVHRGDGQWTLRRTFCNVEKLLPNCRRMWEMQRLSGFCARSGYLFGTGKDGMGAEHHFLIGVDGSSPRLIGGVQSRSSASWIPYEMDWSTYISSCISKMKYF